MIRGDFRCVFRTSTQDSGTEATVSHLKVEACTRKQESLSDNQLSHKSSRFSANPISSYSRTNILNNNIRL